MSEWVRPIPDFLTLTVTFNAMDKSKSEDRMRVLSHSS